MSKLSVDVFKIAAGITGPSLVSVRDESGLAGIASVSASMTATIDVNGKPERIRVTVELDPDEDNAADDAA